MRTGVGYRISGVGIIAMIAAVAMLAGCAGHPAATGDDFTGQAYKALAATRVFYDEGLSACAAAYHKGLLDDRQIQDIIAAGEAFRDAWQAAAETLYAFALSRCDQATVDKKFAAMQAAYLRLAELVSPYLIKAST